MRKRNISKEKHDVYLASMKVYNVAYKKIKGPISSKVADIYIIRKVLPKPYQFCGGIKTTCSYFGCGKQLSPQEQLFGDTCTNHNGKQTKLVR